MRKKTFLIFAIILPLLFCPPVYGETPDIRGIITDAHDSVPIPGATVMVHDNDSIFITGIVAGSNGSFEITELDRGIYDITISFIGYMTEHLRIDHTDQSEFLNIVLTPSSTAISDITVSARQVIDKDDRKLVVPTATQLRTATDAGDLLRKLQLPGIMVDAITGEVTRSSGREVVLKINGMDATSDDLATLSPGDIIRIEYHDDPGVKYNGAAAVIDYITRKRDSGAPFPEIL